MAAPGDQRAGPGQALGEPGRLRIVQQDQVAWPDQLEQLGSVRGEHALVVADLLGRQRPAGDLAVDLVVQALGDHEELGVAGDHHPAAGDPRVLDVAEQHLEHLGHAAADRGRADVPQRPAAELAPELTGRLHQPREPLGADNGRELLDGSLGHSHRLNQAHVSVPSGGESGRAGNPSA